MKSNHIQKRQDPSYHLIYVLSPFEEIKHKKCIIIIPFYKIHKIEPREKKTLKQTSVTDRLKREMREREGGEIGERDREKGERERGEREGKEEKEKGERKRERNDTIPFFNYHSIYLFENTENKY